jgi:hypothetical protein
MKETYYSIGEIFRGQMLLNHNGEPYAHKSTVSKVVNKIGALDKKTAFGMGKMLTLKQIKDYNAEVVID